MHVDCECPHPCPLHPPAADLNQRGLRPGAVGVAIEIPVSQGMQIDPRRVVGMTINLVIAVDLAEEGAHAIEVARALIVGAANNVELRRGAPEPVVKFLERLAKMQPRDDSDTEMMMQINGAAEGARKCLETLGADRLRFEGLCEYTPETRVKLA